MPTGDGRVTVCIPTFDGAAHLERCLSSVTAQSYEDLEILVVDDGSSDATVDIARSAAATDARVHVVTGGGRRGLVGNWNRCLALATGEWVKFVFQDDWIEPACVARLVEAGASRPLVACRRRYVFEGVDDSVVREYRNPIACSIDRLFPGRTVIGPSELAGAALARFGVNIVGEPTAVLFRRRLLDRFGPFDDALISLCDLELWLRIGCTTGLAWVDEELASFRVHGAAASATNRGERAFRRNLLDPMVLWHRFATGPAYAPVRAAAAHASPRIDAWAAAVTLARRSRVQAELFARNRRHPATGPLEEWRHAVAACAGLADAAPVGPLDLARYRARYHLVTRRRRQKGALEAG